MVTGPPALWSLLGEEPPCGASSGRSVAPGSSSWEAPPGGGSSWWCCDRAPVYHGDEILVHSNDRRLLGNELVPAATVTAANSLISFKRHKGIMRHPDAQADGLHIKVKMHHEFCVHKQFTESNDCRLNLKVGNSFAVLVLSIIEYLFET